MIGYIYKIELEGKLLYIGKTTQKLSKRKGAHKSICFSKNKTNYNRLFYKTLREEYNITGKNFSQLINLECIEEVIYEGKFQLQLRERNYIVKLKPSCNKNVPYSFNCDGLTKKEIFKLRYINNKEKLSNKQKIYREKNKDKISKRKKIYREKNKELISKINKVYRNKNKEKISKNNKIKNICSCGCIMNKNSTQKHKRTKKHINLLNKRLGAKYLLHKELLNI